MFTTKPRGARRSELHRLTLGVVAMVLSLAVAVPASAADLPLHDLVGSILSQHGWELRKVDRTSLRLLTRLATNPPAELTTVINARKGLGVDYPSGYEEFLAVSDGAEGDIGGTYVQLWRVQELIQANLDYAVAEFAPGLVLIGADGGDNAFGFIGSGVSAVFIQLPFLGFDLAESRVLGRTFDEFLLALSADYR